MEMSGKYIMLVQKPMYGIESKKIERNMKKLDGSRYK